MADIAYDIWTVVEDDADAATAAPALATDGFDIRAALSLYVRVVPDADVTSWGALVWLYGGAGPSWVPLADSALSGTTAGDVLRIMPLGPHSRAYVQVTAVAGGELDVECFAARRVR
jgi:hypothetical protein